MPKTRPVSDLRNHFTDILQLVRTDVEPVFLTEDGHENMVVMSMEAFEKINLDNEIYTKLNEAEIDRIFKEASKESYNYDKRLFDKKLNPLYFTKIR